MNKPIDEDLFFFASQVIEKHGGVVEEHEDSLVALLPGPLAEALGLPEEVQLGGNGSPLLYGSPLLDRLVQLATQSVPVVYAQIEAPYVKKEGFEQLLSKDLIFVGGIPRVVGRAEARATYMVLVCHYIALSDERKEGLVTVGVEETSGALVPELKDRWSEGTPVFFEPGKIPHQFPDDLEGILACALRGARGHVESELRDFLESMNRRLRRDVANTREYYDALNREMEESLGNPNLTEAQRQERIHKIRELPVEMARKVEDLKQKYSVQITIRGRAALRFLVRVAQVMVELRYRNLKRQIRVIWNPMTRQLDPLVCEKCRDSTRRVYLEEVDSRLALLCSRCSP